ncbi:tetratricopeptide repeat protein [Paludisphaera borealis]|uniref:Beta-barrel assembly-enhancing protease n=1 Tax=Paludisphaera borealis TaxID=1387353 RepID=A0A1U7CN92_9BACT|nr:tetratricopeptide repeat protein [Paludisphaera borealis]APW60353.1 Beta-barrel assembly-enhancing protease [Paludisphaera borealis]
MTVRWKPLLILSGLFLVVALVGVVAITFTLSPRSSQSVLKQARTARDAGRLADAEIYFQQALQLEPKSAPIHEEFAELYEAMAETATADRRDFCRTQRLDHLVKAVNHDKTAKSPRMRLLGLAMAEDGSQDAVYWAREVVKLDPTNLDSNFVLAFEALESRSPNIPEVKRQLKTLEEGKAPEVRRLLVQARLAEATGDEAGRNAALAAGRKLELPADAEPTDLMAKLRLTALDVQTRTVPAERAEQVKSMLAISDRILAAAEVGSQRVTRLSFLLEQAQRDLIRQARAAGKGEAVDPLVETIETQLASIFQKSRQAGDHVDFQMFLTYADHLRFRQQRDRCLQVVDEALALPMASRPSSTQIAMGLHVVASEMALVKADDPSRFDKAAPHLQALIASTEPRYQGLGHLFQGAVDLDRSGLVRTITKTGEKNEAEATVQHKLRASALGHLKAAASQLPDLAEAQARYGVALVLNQEQALGRQYLQSALRMANLDPQYQFWAAWTILQAGYPEEAAPIIESLFSQLAQGTIPADMKVVLHQLSGELYQARRGPGDLERAAKEFEKVTAMGKNADSGAALRLAQIDVQLGKFDDAMAKIEQVRKQGKGDPAAENLAVLVLEQQGKKDEARKLVVDARAKFPESAELVGLDAALKAKDGKADDAEKTLADYLTKHPDNINLGMMRAQLLAAEPLKRPEDARKLLTELAERTDSSSPMVQLALLEMDRDLDAAAAVVAKVKARWKEGATGDVLEGQLSLKRGDVTGAIGHFNEALKKDPENKIVQFWKAQLDGSTGSVAEASKALENIVRDRPSKEVDSGVTLLTAAQSALASLSLKNGNVDDAIRRYEELKKSSETGTLTRGDRWQLITAYVAKGQWPIAKRELALILNDTKQLASDEERVRGANLYRQHKEDEAALAQLDYVLKVNPAHPAAVVTRAFIHLKAKQYDLSSTVLRRAIDLSNTPEQKAPEVLYLMLSAVVNETPPEGTASERALKIIDEGLATQPNSLQLVQAKYLVLSKAGDSKQALAFVESKAKDEPKGPYRRMLIDVYRDQKNFEGAEKLLRELATEFPDDVNVSAALVEVASLSAAHAAASGDADRTRAAEEKSANLIREFRAKYPLNLTFLQAECDQAARGGDYTRALGVTEEIDKAAKNSSMGPLLRGRLFSMMNRPRDVAKAYAEAVEREPRRLDVRVWLGKTSLKLGDVDQALQQAEYVINAKKDQLDADALQARLLQARALDASGSSDAQREAARAKAVTQLEAVIAIEPRFLEAYQTIAEIEMKRNRRPAAIAILKRDLTANPNDGAALAQYVQLLSEPDPASPGARSVGLDEAKKLAAEIGERDKKGSLILAVGVGYHKARRLELALPWSEKAATMLDSPVAHLNLGDLLLSLAESQPEPAKARPYFERAVQQYDLVLKAQPNSIEAVNNKAWVMHSSLGQSQQALELAQALLKRVNPTALPGEFYDTMGAIQEAVGRTTDAEQSYQEGLKRSPDLAVLHYHYGKLIAADKTRTGRAKDHLAKAIAGREQLSPVMADDAVRLVQQISDAGSR